MAQVVRERRTKPAQSEVNELVVKKEVSLPAVGVYQSVLNTDFSHLTLPDKPSIPSNDIKGYSYLIYGEEKIGKTSFVNQFGAFIFAFEKGPSRLSVLTSKVLTSWEMAQHYLKLNEEQPGKYPFYCLDTGHAGYDRCLEYICRRDGIKHPGKVKDYGASWKEILIEFTQFHSRLANLGGFLVISHERTREREGEYGKFDRIEPAFSESTEMFYKAIIDLVGYFHKKDGKRYLQIESNSLVHCGNGIDGKFLTVNGERIHNIPMGNSPKEGYDNFIKAFNNQQKETFQTLTEANSLVTKKIDRLIISGT